MDMDDLTNPVVLVVGGILWFIIVLLLWKVPNAWGMKEKIMITVLMLPISIGITAAMSDK